MPSNVTTNVDVQNYEGLFLSAYEGPVGGLWYKNVTKEYTSNSITDIMPGGRVVSPLQPFGYGNCRTDLLPNTFRYSIVKSPWESHVTLNRQEYEADTLGIFNGMVENMGRKAATDPNKKIAALIATNGNAYDGAPFFGTHSIGVDSAGLIVGTNGAGSALTYTNVVTLTQVPALKVAVTSNVPTDYEAAAIVTQMIGYMLTLPDYSGDAINGDMQSLTIVTGDALTFAAFQGAVTKTILSGTQSNSVQGFEVDGWKIKVVLAPAVAGHVFFFRSDAQVPAFVKTEAEDGIRSSFQGVGSDYQQSCDLVRYNIQVDRGYGYGEPTAAVEATISH